MRKRHRNITCLLLTIVFMILTTEVVNADAKITVSDNGKTLTIENEVPDSWYRNAVYEDIDTDKIIKVIIGDGIEIIEKEAFCGWNKLRVVYLPDSIKQIDDFAFKDCSKLRSINLSSGLQVIGNSVFKNCLALRKIVLPNTVHSLGTEVFYGCSSLKSITFSNQMTAIPNKVCQYTGLTELELSDNIIEIGDYAFANCKDLYEISLPDSITFIGEGAFYYDEMDKTVTLDEREAIIENTTYNNDKKENNIKGNNNISDMIGKFIEAVKLVVFIVSICLVTILGILGLLLIILKYLKRVKVFNDINMDEYTEEHFVLMEKTLIHTEDNRFAELFRKEDRVWTVEIPKEVIDVRVTDIFKLEFNKAFCKRYNGEQLIIKIEHKENAEQRGYVIDEAENIIILTYNKG